MFRLIWQRQNEESKPIEYYAELPSGGTAIVRFERGVWVATTRVFRQQDDNGTFATAYDAQTAIEADESQRLITLGIEATKGPARSASRSSAPAAMLRREL